jgi:hypothetical protein
MLWIDPILCVFFAITALWEFQQQDFGWMIFSLVFVAFHAYQGIQKANDSQKTELYLQISKAEIERIEAVFLLMNELSISCTEEELNAAAKGTMSLDDLRKIMQNRKDMLWSHVKTNCRYFSKSELLKCAVNPTLPCELCQDFKVVGDLDGRSHLAQQTTSFLF